MGLSSSKKINLEKSDEKGTFDDEALLEYIQKAKNGTCQIILGNDTYGSGCFCKIPYTNNNNIYLNVLLTCNHLLNNSVVESDGNIKIKVNDNIKILSLKDRKKWCNGFLDYSCIEIIDEDEINDFYQIDDIILKKNYKNELYIKKHIIIFAIMKNRKRGHSNGIIKKIENYYFYHNCNTDKGCSGGLIINSNNNCIIGIHQGEDKDNNINIGIFIYDIIKDIINQNNNNINAIDDNNDMMKDIAIKKQALIEHNKKREIHNVVELKLSKELCEKAKKRISKLIEMDDELIQYDENEEDLGENLYINYQGPVDIKTICNSWYNEKNKFDFNNNKYQKGTGHFTQMIWKKTKEVGFGWGTSKNNKFYFLAYYFPGGNVIGKFKENVLVEQ